MLLLKISTICCLFACAKGYSIDYEEEFPNIDDAKYEANYNMNNWDIYETTHKHVSQLYHNYDQEDTINRDDEENFDSWSIVWYIASFGGLIAFFLVVSCSEWCCRKHARENQARAPIVPIAPSTPSTPESAPPAYDLFAPPSYDSLITTTTNEKAEFDIYVVPVHTIGTLVDTNSSQQEENPPSYTSISVEERDTRTAPMT